MPIPCNSDNLTFDANAFINYALLFGPIRSYFAQPLHDLKVHCDKRIIEIGYFDFIRNQSYKNLAYSVSQFAKTRGIKSHYQIMNFRNQGIEHLNKMFENLTQFEEIFSDYEIEEVHKFFQNYEKDIQLVLNLQHPKPNIPENHDLKLLVCCENTPCDKMYLVSDDGHFIAYEVEIESHYAVGILPMKDIRLKMNEWKWT